MKLRQHTPQIFTIKNFLSKEECLAYIQLSEQTGYELSKINTDSGPEVVLDVRNNSRAFLHSTDHANALWEKAKPFIPQRIGNSVAIGLNELIRFYRYQPGQQFKGHYDGSYIRNEVEASYMTFMIYLNSNFKGGETTFPEKWIKPKQGTALEFMHNIYHSGREIRKGVKYVLRTDVMYRLNEE